MKKVSVLMPAFNDAETLPEALSSVLNQTYSNLEILFMDDGSSDETSQVLSQFKDNRLKVFNQPNQGQLNALYNLVPHISGEFVCLLHSDDRVCTPRSFEENVAYLEKTEASGLFGDLETMDKKGQITGTIPCRKKVHSSILAQYYFKNGSNPIPDPFFCTKSLFLENVFPEYLLWNKPYWFRKKNGKIQLAKISKIPNPWYCYRLFEGNYIHSMMGKLVRISGVIRGILDIHSSLFFPVSPLQEILQKGLKSPPTLFFPNHQKRDFLPKLFKILLGSFSRTQIQENPYLHSLVEFWRKKNPRQISLSPSLFPENQTLYYGKDARMFFFAMERKQIPEWVALFIREMKSGFSSIRVPPGLEKKTIQALRFLNIQAQVEISEKNSLQ